MNLFIAENNGNDTVVCKIIDKLGDTLCSVEDRRGGKFEAESNGTYKTGQWVVVKNGIVVGKSRKAQTVHHFNV